MKVKSESEVAQLCPTLSDPMDCSLPGSSIHGSFQARVLEWVAIAFSDDYTVEVKNRFKGLDLIDRVLDKLWMEVCDIVQEVMNKTISRKKKWKKAKWFSEEALRIVKKRRETKDKGEKEIYTHLNAEVQRTARRDKKAFFNDQCKEIEENNRMGKTRALFKKIKDTKGTFHAKMGKIKDRNGMDLTKQKILRRGGKYTQKKYTKKIFMTEITTMV